ncbi:unnamed protein product [Mucor fragilis]
MTLNSCVCHKSFGSVLFIFEDNFNHILHIFSVDRVLSKANPVFITLTQYAKKFFFTGVKVHVVVPERFHLKREQPVSYRFD